MFVPQEDTPQETVRSATAAPCARLAVRRYRDLSPAAKDKLMFGLATLIGSTLFVVLFEATFRVFSTLSQVWLLDQF